MQEKEPRSSKVIGMNQERKIRRKTREQYEQIQEKTKQKISGGFRSFDGAGAFANIRSFLSTVSKRKYNILQALTDALKGDFTCLI